MFSLKKTQISIDRRQKRLRQLINRVLGVKNAPILKAKYYKQRSVFKPKNLLREARRQLGVAFGSVPDFVVLDPDGDILDHLAKTGEVTLNPYWACYHTKLYEFKLGRSKLGIIGRAVGGSFAVLLAEQLFASGCKFIINITSAGKIEDNLKTPSYILVNKALRDEGTSLHYLPPADFVSIRPELLSVFSLASWRKELRVKVGSVWTTDAPYRETAGAIESAKRRGLLAVEMETASLYAFAEATSNFVISFAFVTNEMAQKGEDFEKGDSGGAIDALELIEETVGVLKQIFY